MAHERLSWCSRVVTSRHQGRCASAETGDPLEHEADRQAAAVSSGAMDATQRCLCRRCRALRRDQADGTADPEAEADPAATPPDQVHPPSVAEDARQRKYTCISGADPSKPKSRPFEAEEASRCRIPLDSARTTIDQAVANLANAIRHTLPRPSVLFTSTPTTLPDKGNIRADQSRLHRHPGRTQQPQDRGSLIFGTCDDKDCNANPAPAGL